MVFLLNLLPKVGVDFDLRDQVCGYADWDVGYLL